MYVTSWFYCLLDMPLFLPAWFYGMFVDLIERVRRFLELTNIGVNGMAYAEKKSTGKNRSPSRKTYDYEQVHPVRPPLPSEMDLSRTVLEASLSRPEKHLMFVRGVAWDVSPPYTETRADSFNIMLHCLYFPSKVDWNFDVSVRGTVSCQRDANTIMELTEIKAKLSKEESIVKLNFNKSDSGLSDKQWKQLDRFKIEITMDNFEGYRDPTPSQFVVNVEDPTIKHDRVLIVEGRKMYVQSTILSLWSTHFANMFNSSGDADKKEIVIDDVKAEEFIEMLHAMYTSNKPVAVDSVNSLLDLAARFKMVKLAIKCCHVIANAPKGTFNSAQLIRFTRKYRSLAQESFGGLGNYLDTDLLSNGHLEWKSKKLRPNFEKPTVPHDKVITIGKRRIHVLSAVLAARSSYFASLFDSNNLDQNEITLNNVSADNFIKLLHAIYPTEIIEDDSVAMLLSLAKRFDIPWLTARCSLYLCTLEYRGMPLIPLVKLAFEYKLEQVKSWLFAKASRELHGCIYLFMRKNEEEISKLSPEIQQFFQCILHDWQYISCPTGSESLPRPEMKYRLNLSMLPRGGCYFIYPEGDSYSITPL